MKSKNSTEIAGTTSAHIRDGVAICEFLAWLSAQGATPSLTEIDIVQKLESFRATTADFKNISFDTICGTGPHGAIMHYRVTKDTNAKIATNSLLLIDSGAQYIDGTTDITRTITIGTPPLDARNHEYCYTIRNIRHDRYK